MFCIIFIYALQFYYYFAKNTFIVQGCIKLIKSDGKCIYVYIAALLHFLFIKES